MERMMTLYSTTLVSVINCIKNDLMSFAFDDFYRCKTILFELFI